MDILFWKNMVEDLGAGADVINENTNLGMFNKVYNEVSLFQYFAENTEVIEMFNTRFK